MSEVRHPLSTLDCNRSSLDRGSGFRGATPFRWRGLGLDFEEILHVTVWNWLVPHSTNRVKVLRSVH